MPKNTNANQKTFGKTNTAKFLKVSDPPLDMGLVVLFVFAVFLKVFCCFGFPDGLFSCLKPSGKPTKSEKQTNKTNPYPRVGLKPLTTLCCWFSRMLFWFSLVFFGIFGFPEGLFCFLKTFGKTNNTKIK